MKHNNPAYQQPILPGALKRELIDKLAYFGVFKHPLNAEELQNLLHNYYALERVSQALEELTETGLCYSALGYYSMFPDVADQSDKRQNQEKNATQYFEKLPFYARLIASFPFVRGVAVSGSLSKGVIHQDGDIDYFIVTAHGRLWLARMFLVLFKKVVLQNSRRYFCVNYFVSEHHLEIPDQNVFTATEVTTLIPVFNPSAIRQFKASNPWVKMYYGHFEHPISVTAQNVRLKRVKRLVEWLLNNALGDVLDILSMHITVWRWHIKFKTYSRSKFDLTLRSTRNVSKHHPRNFQTVVLTQVEANRAEIYKRLEKSK